MSFRVHDKNLEKFVDGHSILHTFCTICPLRPTGEYQEMANKNFPWTCVLLIFWCVIGDHVEYIFWSFVEAKYFSHTFMIIFVLQVSTSHLLTFCVILSWWLSSCRRRSWATTMLHRESDMRRYPDPQQLWWQSICSCRSQALEHFTATSQRWGLAVQSVPAVTKYIFVWTMGLRRSVNYFNCADLLTYLLTIARGCQHSALHQRHPANFAVSLYAIFSGRKPHVIDHLRF